MKGKRKLKRVTLLLPPAVVERLKRVAAQKTERELKRASLASVVLEAVVATYFTRKKKRRRTAAKRGVAK